ncbi:MAG: hybrid sensor histidine kinase/response regulator [Anaerolineae bacterium]
MFATSLDSKVIPLAQRVPQILIVDDELNNRLLLSRILRRLGSITEASSAREALELLQEEQFDLVLLDIMMPDMTGLEALEVIRNNRDTAHLPIILVSALSDNEDLVHGLQIGANDYIPKPFDIDVVYARVNTQLRLKMMSDDDKQVIAQLEAMQQMKDRLLRIASHDLKAPLANIKTIEVLLREYVSDPQGVEFLEMLRSTINNMHSVIEEFLDMAAFQGGTLAVELAPVEVEQVVMDVMMHYCPAAQEKDIDIMAYALPGIVHADQQRLTQVLNNLVSNAIKYSPRRTTISLWSEIDEGRVRINVADQGPGIPANERDRLFKEFSKLSTRPTAGESSTGLGLWIVKQMVTLQGGTVGVDCPSDGGSTFWVEFPVSSP